MTSELSGQVDRRWMQTDISDLRARSIAGESLFDIARALARTEEAVRHMAARLAVRISNQGKAALLDENVAKAVVIRGS